MDTTKLSEERIDNLIQDLEEWMTLVADEEYWLSHEDDDIVKLWGSKTNYLEDLIDWVYCHVCSEDKHNPEWWMSHGFTEEEAMSNALN